MEKIKVDLLRQKYHLDTTRKPPFFVYGKFLLATLIFCAVLSAAFSYRVTTSDVANDSFSFFSALSQMVGSGERLLEGEEDDRVNILLLGVGGEGHEGPQLSDTMIFGSWRPSTNTVGTISIPRDLSVPIPGYGWRKINHANAYGELDGEGMGPKLASTVVENILAQPVHYYLRVDFDGFAKLIDDLGGIDVYVEQAFADYSYPVSGMENAECETDTTMQETVTDEEQTETDEETEENPAPSYDCRFETISFEQGWVKMDGDTALKFVRSRHGTNGESSDFARSRRQQQVLLALKSNIFSTSTLLNPSRISSLLNALEDNISTNLSVWEIVRLAKVFRSIDASHISSHVLDTSESSPLYATILDGAYVLLPKNNDWRPIQAMAAHIFLSDEEIASQKITDTVSWIMQDPNAIKIEVQNGTTITGLASATSQKLDAQGMAVLKIGNAAVRNYAYTTIYDFTDGAKAEALQTISQTVQADLLASASGWMMTGTMSPPEEIASFVETLPNLATQPSVDFLIILGTTSPDPVSPL
jgi:LCP family protein required for cell wall assembly